MSDRVDRVENPGVEDHLSEIYHLHSRWLTARLRRRVGAQLAEDLVQETYLRIAVYLRAGEVRYPKALLLRIASNLMVDAQRRAKAATQAHATLNDEHDAPRQGQALLLKQLILSLPAPLQEVFVLSRFGGLTNIQIGERLGLSVKTVEWRMSKALAHCAAQLRL